MQHYLLNDSDLNVKKAHERESPVPFELFIVTTIYVYSAPITAAASHHHPHKVTANPPWPHSEKGLPNAVLIFYMLELSRNVQSKKTQNLK